MEKFTVTRNEEKQNCQKTGLLRLLEANRQILSSKQALMVARVEKKKTKNKQKKNSSCLEVRNQVLEGTKF